MKTLLTLLVLGVLSTPALAFNKPVFAVNQSTYLDNHEYADIISNAETTAPPTVREILLTARQMVEDGTIVKGGCWNYLDTAWNRAGVGRSQRHVVFKTDKDKPPYAKLDDLQAGDWLYHINYGYRGIEHSGMFIGWLDKDNAIGITLSYAGEHRKEPARYKPYDLSGVYRITRAAP